VLLIPTTPRQALLIRFLFLSIGGRIRLRFFATDGKKLTPSHNHCQTQYKKTAKKMQK